MRSLLLIALSGAWLSAAQSEPQAPGSPSGQPARDRPGITAPAGRGIIRGRVVDFTTGEAVPRALVRIWGPSSLAMFTRPDGSFDFGDLSAGDYSIYVTRNGYLEDNGSGRPGRRATSLLAVGANGDIATVEITLMRAGVIGGQVTDEFGEPATGVQVRVGRSFYVNGRRQLLSVASMGRVQQTDDEGRFRVGNLKPGKYVVWTLPLYSEVSEGLVGESPQSYLKTFAPGVRDLESAATIELGPGERNVGVNITLARGRAVNVSGMVVAADGSPLTGVVVSLETFEQGVGYANFGGGPPSEMADKQGHFAFSNVTPGEYALTVRNVRAPGQLYAQIPFDVRDTDITDVVVRQNITTITVRVVTEDSTSIGKPERLVQGVELLAESPALQQLDTELRPDGTLTMKVAAGRYWVRASVPRGAIRQVLFNGADVTDAPIEIREDLHDAQLTLVLTSRLSRLDGTVVDDAGKPANGVLVVAFSTIPERWRLPATRYVVAQATAGNGAFTVQGLPAGDYYVSVATDIDRHPYLDFYGIDPDVLDRLRPSATMVTVGDGQTAHVSLRMKPQ